VGITTRISVSRWHGCIRWQFRALEDLNLHHVNKPQLVVECERVCGQNPDVQTNSFANASLHFVWTDLSKEAASQRTRRATKTDFFFEQHKWKKPHCAGIEGWLFLVPTS
jgi:hypothetical protein